MANDSSQPVKSAPSRRSFMVGSGAVAATAALAACTSQGGGPKRATEPTGSELGSTSEVPVGGGKIFGAASIVVTQPTEGEFIGLSAVCTHQNCTLRSVVEGEIECGCHGSRFDLTGEVLKGPATQPLPAKKINVVDGKITVG